MEHAERVQGEIDGQEVALSFRQGPGEGGVEADLAKGREGRCSEEIQPDAQGVVDLVVAVGFAERVGGGGLFRPGGASDRVLEFGRLVLPVAGDDRYRARARCRWRRRAPAEDGYELGVRIGLLGDDVHALGKGLPRDPAISPHLRQRLTPPVEQFGRSSADDDPHVRLPAVMDPGQGLQEEGLRREDTRQPDHPDALRMTVP